MFSKVSSQEYFVTILCVWMSDIINSIEASCRHQLWVKQVESVNYRQFSNIIIKKSHNRKTTDEDLLLTVKNMM